MRVGYGNVKVAPANDRLARPIRSADSSAEITRSHAEEGALFQTLASEFQDVVEFDAFCQFDRAANWVKRHIGGPYKSKLEARRPEPVPKEENEFVVGVPESTANSRPPQQSGKSSSADSRLARETWSQVVVYATDEHRTSAVGKSFLRQPSRGSLLGGRTTFLLLAATLDCENFCPEVSLKR
jgi:hypothetical protein